MKYSSNSPSGDAVQASVKPQSPSERPRQQKVSPAEGETVRTRSAPVSSASSTGKAGGNWIWKGAYEGVNARISLTRGWKTLLWENDEYLPHEVSFRRCSDEEWRKWVRRERNIYIAPPLYGEAIANGKRFLIFPVFVRGKFGRMMDEMKGFQVAVGDPKAGATNKAAYFVKVEGSEKR